MDDRLSTSANKNSQTPVPVVQVLSIRGLEYAMQTFVLAGWSISLVSIVLALINGVNEFSELSSPLSVLLVTLPVFAWLFVRLRRQEAANPSQKLEASRRRFAQLIQLVTFGISLSTLIALVYLILQIVGGTQTGTIWKRILSYVVVLFVSKGIFLYYWLENNSFMKWGKK